MRALVYLLWVALAGAPLGCTSRGAGAPAPSRPAAAAQYRCPMHPDVVQDHAGDCPACNMKLVPVPQATAATGAAHAAPGAIAVGADAQQVVGIRAAPVEQGAGTRTLRLPGRVAPDENRLYLVKAGVEGSVRDVGPATTGTFVRKNQVLGSYYAPTAYSTIQLFITNVSGKEYLVQRHTEGSVEGEGVSLGYANIQQRIIQLENLGVSALQREELARTRTIPDTIWIVAPASGFVLARNVSPGVKFDRGEELYRIADLRRVWVLTDVFLQDARHVRAGLKATVSVPEQGVALPATVAEILPQFDAATRTLGVRLELDNPEHVLRPDMLVDVELDVELPAAMTIPADAIVDSGLAKTVFVESGEGTFEPRRVQTGWRSGDRVEVVKGLSPGERIVVAGTFFLDSESRLRSPASGAVAADRAAPDPTGRARAAGSGGAGHSSAAPHVRGHETTHARAGASR